jgi:transcriptional regulator with XRE-family HTH domain
MIPELFNISDRLKNLRQNKGITQTQLAKLLSLTRSSINGWEMGTSIPSIQYVVELSKIYNVSTDYILGTDTRVVIYADGLSEKDICAVNAIIDCLKDKKD